MKILLIDNSVLASYRLKWPSLFFSKNPRRSEPSKAWFRSVVAGEVLSLGLQMRSSPVKRGNSVGFSSLSSKAVYVFTT